MKGVTDNNLKDFVDYFNSFYSNETGLYPKTLPNLTDKEVRLGVLCRIKDRPDFPFDGDTSDREMVRDLLLESRGVQ